MPQQGVKMMITPLLIATVVKFTSENRHVATSIDAYANVRLSEVDSTTVVCSNGVSTTLTPLVCDGRARG